jgi:hypothetical protein
MEGIGVAEILPSLEQRRIICFELPVGRLGVYGHLRHLEWTGQEACPTPTRANGDVWEL